MPNTALHLCMRHIAPSDTTLRHVNFVHNPPPPPILSLRCAATPVRRKINRSATRVGTFEVCVAVHVALRMCIMQVLAIILASQSLKNMEDIYNR